MEEKGEVVDRKVGEEREELQEKRKVRRQQKSLGRKKYRGCAVRRGIVGRCNLFSSGSLSSTRVSFHLFYFAQLKLQPTLQHLPKMIYLQV